MNDAAGSHATKRAPERQRSVLWRGFGVALTALALLIGAAVPAAAAELMRVTFVRHGQSAGNASGLIDTSTPGPVLTPTGQLQSQAVVGTLGDNNYDAVYASTMVRTQLTAAPMSQYLGLPIQVLPGLQEIEAGVFEGTPESQAASGYGLYPLAWAIQGNRDLRIPQSIDGNEFDARVDGALKTIYDNGDRNAVVFSHGGAIMFWTMMNAQNLTAAQKIDLLRTAPLSNTNYVIVEGNAEDGWTLVNWNGKLFSPEPTLGAEIKLQRRTLNRQLSASGKQFFESLASRDFATIATAFNRSIAEARLSVAKYHRAIQAKIINDLSKKFETPVETPTTVSTLTADDNDTATDTEATAAIAADDDAPKATVRRSTSKSEAGNPSDDEETVTDDAADLNDDAKLDDDSSVTDPSEDTTADDEKPAADSDESADAGSDSDGSSDQGGDAQRDAA